MKWLLAVALVLWTTCEAAAAGPSSTESLAGRSAEWPTWQQWQRVLMLRDYNTRVVVFGVAILGGAAGLVGTILR